MSLTRKTRTATPPLHMERGLGGEVVVKLAGDPLGRPYAASTRSCWGCGLTPPLHMERGLGGEVVVKLAGDPLGRPYAASTR